MDPQQASRAGEGVACEGMLPLAWREAASEPDALRLAGLAERNQAVVRTVLALEDLGTESAEDGGGAGGELARIESKLNLLLDLVAELLDGQRTVPASRPVRLSSTWIEWGGSNLPPIGARVEVEIYLHPSFPRPLRLGGEIGAGRAFETPSVLLAFDPLPEPGQESLERLVFRRHRRAIAQERARQRPAP